MRTLALGVAGLVTVLAPCLSAHDIPRDVTVHAFVKPKGRHLQLLVRVPLKAIMDVEFPRRERDYVDLAHVDSALRAAATLYVSNQIDLYEGDDLLPAPRIVSTRISVESDRSFVSYDAALAHVMGPPLPDRETLFWEQGLLDVRFEYPIQSERSAFSIRATFDRLALRVVTVLDFLAPGGTVRAYELQGDAGLLPLDPAWHQAAMRFVRLGFFHPLADAGHLLFLLCLVIPFRRLGALAAIVTSFTIAHSITLLASASGYTPDALWVPPLVDTLIAASIVYVALENIVGARLQRRWPIAIAFGLVYGVGFSFGLQHTLQFAGSHPWTSLLSFNIGVELGQLLVLALLVPALDLLFRFVVAERMGTAILSALAAHTAWHWMTDRVAVLRQYPIPAVTLAALASGLRWLMLLVVLGGAAWAAVSRRAIGHYAPSRRHHEPKMKPVD